MLFTEILLESDTQKQELGVQTLRDFINNWNPLKPEAYLRLYANHMKQAKQFRRVQQSEKARAEYTNAVDICERLLAKCPEITAKPCRK